MKWLSRHLIRGAVIMFLVAGLVVASVGSASAQAPVRGNASATASAPRVSGASATGSKVRKPDRYATADGTITDALGTRKIKKGAPIYDENSPYQTLSGCDDSEHLMSANFWVSSTAPNLPIRKYSCASGQTLGFLGYLQAVHIVQSVPYSEELTSNGCVSSTWYNLEGGGWIWAGSTDYPQWKYPC